MCWSLEVSVLAGSTAYGSALFLWNRNKTIRDRWNAIFLSVFGTIQWLEAVAWFLESAEGLSTCSSRNMYLSRAFFVVLMAEPFASLFAMWYATNKRPSPTTMITYITLFILIPMSIATRFFYVFSTGDALHCAFPSCTYIAESGHLMTAPGVSVNLDTRCWRSYVFWGEWQDEIPLALRIAFLGGMAGPYVYMKPRRAAYTNITILVLTWLYGYFSASHQSLWCFANIGQIVVMVADPLLFRTKHD